MVWVSLQLRTWSRQKAKGADLSTYVIDNTVKFLFGNLGAT